MNRHLGILFMTVALLSMAGLGWAEDAASHQAGKEVAGQDVISEDAAVDGGTAEAAPIHGMQMWVDQETGALRAPTREEAAYFSGLLKKMFAQKAAAPQMRVLKNGTLAAALGESMMEFSVVRVEADGSLSQGCVDDADQALEFVATTAHIAQEEE